MCQYVCGVRTIGISTREESQILERSITTVFSVSLQAFSVVSIGIGVGSMQRVTTIMHHEGILYRLLPWNILF